MQLVIFLEAQKSISAAAHDAADVHNALTFWTAFLVSLQFRFDWLDHDLCRRIRNSNSIGCDARTLWMNSSEGVTRVTADGTHWPSRQQVNRIRLSLRHVFLLRVE